MESKETSKILLSLLNYRQSLCMEKMMFDTPIISPAGAIEVQVFILHCVCWIPPGIHSATQGKDIVGVGGDLSITPARMLHAL